MLAPILAPTLTASLGAALGVAAGTTTLATLGLMIEGALIGGISAGLSGNTGGILKGAFTGGWMAGFGSVMGNILEKSKTITQLNNLFSKGATMTKVGDTLISQGVVTKTLVVGMSTAVQIGLQDGKLSEGLLISIGSTLALGSSKEIGFVEKLNEKFASVLVSATITSVVTRSDFLENLAMIGASTLVQSTASHLGAQIVTNATKEQNRRTELESSDALRELSFIAEKGEGTVHLASSQQVDSANNKVERTPIQKPVLADNTDTKPQHTHLSFANIPEDIEQFYTPSHLKPMVAKRQEALKSANNNPQNESKSQQVVLSGNGKTKVLIQQLAHVPE